MDPSPRWLSSGENDGSDTSCGDHQYTEWRNLNSPSCLDHAVSPLSGTGRQALSKSVAQTAVHRRENGVPPFVF